MSKYNKEFKLSVIREREQGASFHSIEKKYNLHAARSLIAGPRNFRPPPAFRPGLRRKRLCPGLIC